MLHIHTTQLSTLVPAAGALLAAAFLTSEHHVLFSLNGCTRNFLAVTAASAFDRGGQRARATAVLMAELFTQVDRITISTWQRFVAGLATGGDRVSTGLSLWVAKLQKLR